MVLGSMLGGFWDHIGLQKPFKIRSWFSDMFRRLDPTSRGRGKHFDARVSSPDPPRAAPLSRAEGSYNDLRIATTRSSTPWARGPANLIGFIRIIDILRVLDVSSIFYWLYTHGWYFTGFRRIIDIWLVLDIWLIFWLCFDVSLIFDWL